MKAGLISGYRTVSAEGHITEVRIWRLPAPVPPCSHCYKYRLAYVVDGIRVIGFDNERGKGDHCHIDGVEYPYAFVDRETLAKDFIREIERWQSAG